MPISHSHFRKQVPRSTARLFLLGLALAGLMLFVLTLAPTPPALAAAGDITGTVFQDFNANGIRDTTQTINNDGQGTITVAIDRVVANVTVNAYCVTNRGADTILGTADDTITTFGPFTSNSSGAYTIATTGVITPSAGETTLGKKACRLEFTNLPTGYFDSTHGTGSATTVQFANADSTGVDLGVNYPSDYCQNNPTLVTNCYVYGNQTGSQPNPFGTGTVNVSNLYTLKGLKYSAGATGDGHTAGFTNGVAANYDTTAAATPNMQAQQIGSTWGMAYARSTKVLYAAAFFKRHAGFGSGGPGKVYVIDPAGSSVINTFTIPGATTDAHDSSNWNTDNGNTGWDAVGKTSLGGMALSDDDSTLYVMNLENRTLYALNPTSGAVSTSQAFTALTPPAALTAGGSQTCNSLDVRPFAVTYYRGTLYVGAVCSAEHATTVDTFVSGSNGCPAGQYYPPNSTACGAYPNTGSTFTDNDGNGFYNTGDARGLYAYVYAVNPSTLAITTTPVFSTRLNYTRRSGDGGQCKNPFDGAANPVNTNGNGVWLPWRTTYSTVNDRNLGTANNCGMYSQPMVSDIQFDNGNLLLGLRDRHADQMGNTANDDQSRPTFSFFATAAGQVLRACGSPNSWTLEANGRCSAIGNAPQGNGLGPNGTTVNSAEYYYDQGYREWQDYTPVGGLAQIPGFPHVVSTTFDPIPVWTGVSLQGGGTATTDYTYDGGLRWFQNDNTLANSRAGLLQKAFRVFDGEAPSVEAFGKVNGMGDVIALCDSAPLEIGNRIWTDLNANGVQDPGESPLASITVELWADTNGDGTVDTQVGTAVTDANGNYYFGGPTNANLTSGTAASQINGGTDDAEETVSSGAVVTNSPTLNIPENGTTKQLVGLRFNLVNVPRMASITGAQIQFTSNAFQSVAPVNVLIQGQSADNAATFTTTTNNISGRTKTTASAAWTGVPPWSNNESGADTTTNSVSSIVQEIVNRTGWASNNSMAFILSDLLNSSTGERDADSFDGSSADAATLTVNWQNILKTGTKYEVRVPTTQTNIANAFLNLTIPNNGGSPNGNLRDSDAVQSGNNAVITTTTGSAGANDHNLDVGFVPRFSIGNRVWYDTNNNGILDNTEVGIGGISVSLLAQSTVIVNGTTYTAGQVISTVNTSSSGNIGYFRFDDLPPGSYTTRINSSNFTGAGTLVGYSSSNTTVNAATNTTDLRDAGIDNADSPTSGITTNTFTLGYSAALGTPNGNAPLNETDGVNLPTTLNTTDNRSNLTVDFGFYRLTVNGRVFNDNGAGGGGLNNALQAGTEPGINNVRVELYKGADLVGVAFTDSSGNYSFTQQTNSSGTGNGKPLLPGTDYTIKIPSSANNPSLVGFYSSTDISTTANPTNTGNGVTNDDNGLGGGATATHTFTTSSFTLGATGTTNTAGSTATNSTATTAQPTIYFGFQSSTPTAATLGELEAELAADNSVTLRWDTLSELNLTGFNVLRGESKRGPFTALNAELIAAQKPGQISGTNYTFTDTTTAPATNYFYKIEAVLTDQTTQTTDAVKVTTGAGACSAVAAPSLIGPTNDKRVKKAKIKFTWNPVECAATYKWQLRADSPDGAAVQNKKGLTETTLSIKGLEVNKTYVWRVQACNAANQCTSGEWWSFKAKPSKSK